MKRLLLIAYLFPPVGGGGVQRPVKFVKYLGGFGWRSLVLTPDRPSAPSRDYSLIRELPPDLSVSHLPSFEPRVSGAGGGATGGPAGRGWFRTALKHLALEVLFPDRHVLWLPSALPGALAAGLRFRPDAVMVTAPPFSSFLLGWAVAAFLRLPLVLDFRDEWSGFYAQGYSPTARPGMRARLVRALEGPLVRRAALVTTASEAYAERFRRLYGGPADKYLWIPNGYDPADYRDLPPPRPAEPGRLRLMYSGTIFGVTSLRHLWAGLARLAPEERRRITVSVAGQATDGEVMDPELEGLSVEVLGYLPHEQVIHRLAEADAAVLTLEELPGSERVIPAKVMEYLAVRKPILALTPRGQASRIVEACGAGVVVPPGRPDELADLLRAWLGAPPPPSGPPPALFDRQRLTGLLARALERISGGRPWR